MPAGSLETELMLKARARRRRLEGDSKAAPATAPESAPHDPNDSNDPRNFLAMPGTENKTPYREPTIEENVLRALNYADDTGAILGDGVTRGIAALAGAPVDLVNASPLALNLIPGMKASPMSGGRPPVGGSVFFNDLIHGRNIGLGEGLPRAPEPSDPLQAVVQRVGFEVGANALPVGGSMTAAARLGREGLDALSPITRLFVEPAVVDAGGFVGREAGAAVAAGTGAGVANEIAQADQLGDNFWSDFFGSTFGLGAYGVTNAMVGAGKNVVAGATGSPRFVDDVAGREVADRLINNSTTMAEMSARTGGHVDTRGLAAQLRQPAPVEEAVPGYQANIGDRSRDPGLATFAFNQDSVSPGAANARRAANDVAVNDRMADLNPGGDAAQFRADLESGRDATLTAADQHAYDLDAEFQRALDRLHPVYAQAEARGATVRSALDGAEQAARGVEDDAWSRVDGEVDPSSLANRFAAVANELPVARRQIVADLENALGIPATFEGPVPLDEITALRSRLLTERRNALRGPQPDSNRAEVLGRYIEEVDAFLETETSAETQAALGAARAASVDVNERFNRPNDPIAKVLSRKEGRPDMPDSAVTRTFVQPDDAQASNIDRLLAETDPTSQAPAVRDAIRDEILADIRSRGLLNHPERVPDYLQRYTHVFERFPDLRSEIDAAAGAGREANDATRRAADTRRDLTTPGRSATANYLRFADEAAADAVRTVISSPRPREAMRELLANAGGNEAARQNARAALWTEVQRRGRLQAPGVGGEVRWNGKTLRDMFADPKVNAVAQELWSDNPADLEDIRRVFDALAQAESSSRTRVPGSSGTAQAITGKLDPALTAASVASRARSVNRGVLSPSIALIDITATWLRGRAAQVQSRAIDTIASTVVNNPGLAADLLERFNPADYAARRRLITQKYGVRATQLLNLLDEVDNEEGE